MLNQEVLKYLNKFKKLAFAVSGGKDSMCLLHLALNCIEKDKILVVTVHHNLRQQEGERDRDFVINFCAKNNIECLVFEENIYKFAEENKYTIEQAARIRRHDIFKKLVEEKKAERVVLAHHKDDQVESILMHIFRGSGIQGLVGMQKDTGILLRPLLDVSSYEIKQYIDKNSIEYVEDSTNATLDYSRNRIRNIVVPEIENVYKNFKENILRLADISQETLEYIKEKAPICEKKEDGVYLKIKDIQQRNIVTDQAIINAIEKAFTRINLEMCHIDSVYGLLDKENGKSVTLPFNVKCIKEYDYLVFYKENKLEFKPFVFDLGEYIIANKKLIITTNKIDGLRVDLDKVKGSVIRLRNAKDSFKKFKGGRKSLGDYLTDKKVPKRLRDDVIVIAKEEDILVVVNYEIADSVKIDENTKNIAYIALIENHD